MARRDMVLPTREDGSNEVDADYNDMRVPAALDHDWPARAAGYYFPRYYPDQDEPCERHLYDVIEATRTRYDEDDNEIQDFRARLTCVVCGRVYGWEGTRTESKELGRLEVEPIVAGALRAQQVKPSRSSWNRDRDTSDWTVYDADGRRVGLISWARGPRGRAYFAGRLTAWEPGRSEQGPTPIAVLRRLSRAEAAGARAAG